MTWTFHHPRMSLADLGLLPLILSGRSSLSFPEQIAEGYAHGGGWMPFGAGSWSFAAGTLTYTDPEGDEVYPALASLPHASNGTTLYFFEHAIVAIVGPDSLQVCRMD